MTISAAIAIACFGVVLTIAAEWRHVEAVGMEMLAGLVAVAALVAGGLALAFGCPS